MYIKTNGPTVFIKKKKEITMDLKIKPREKPDKRLPSSKK